MTPQHTMTKPACGTCRHYEPDQNDATGACYLNPPAVFANGCTQRPSVRVTTRACGHYAVQQEALPTTREEALAALHETNPAESANTMGGESPKAIMERNSRKGRR